MVAHAPPIKDVLSSRQTPSGQDRYSFFSPKFKQQRKEWAKLTFLTFGLISIFMFLFLSIYFGSYYRQIPRAAKLNVEVLNLDSVASPTGSNHAAVLGPAVEQAVSNAFNSQPHLGWFYTDQDTLNTMRIADGGRGVVPFDYALARVNNQDVWAVLIVNANATSGAWDAIENGASWDPTGAITYVYEEARNFYATDQYVSRLATLLMTSATSSASTDLALQVLQSNNAATLLAAAPADAVMGAFSYNEHNLHPFDMFAGIAATTVGTVYLIIFTFLISLTWNNVALPIIANKLTLGSEVFIKLIVPFVGYFWLSLNYSLVSLAFNVRFQRQFGQGGFVVYWMANWVTMSALGFVMETVFLWLGPFFPFFLAFWVIINVSVAFLSITDAASFYRYGYAFPIWNLVDASKSIIFATKNHLVQNFAVNLGWLAVWMVLLAITVIYQRRKKETARMKEVWAEMKHKDQEATIREEEAKAKAVRRAGEA